MSTQALRVGCHRFVRASRLHLVVARFSRLALRARQDAFVLPIHLRLCHLLFGIEFSNLALRRSQWTIWPHLTGCQFFQFLAFNLFHELWILVNVEQNTEKTLLVSRTKQLVFPRRSLFYPAKFRSVCSPNSVVDCPVVDGDLGMFCLDRFPWENRLKLAACIVAEGVVGHFYKHSCFYF